ncbi:hypothetical protein HN587_06145 [Candidatus Woesearchaeota archaeon]|jgi:hypothetical protein|nr:hypothetical protein [Candidatus Woesearchaeota archaeon]
MSLMRILEIIQASSLVLAIVILLSEHYHFFDVFTPELKSLLSVIVAFFLIIHSLILLFSAFKEQVKVRILIEAIVVVACAALLLSPAFNDLFVIDFLNFFILVDKEVVSHLAVGLLPIIVVSIVDIFREGGE